MYNLGWMTSCSPLYVSKLPDWKHHDALLTVLRNKYPNLNIIVPIPQAGAPSMMKRLYNKDTSVLYHTLRDLNIEFRSNLAPVESMADHLDGLVLDGLAVFQEVIVPTGGIDRVCTADQQYRYLYELVKAMLSLGKPVILVDNDKVCTRPFNPEEDNVLRRLFCTFVTAKSLYVFSPYQQSLVKLGLPESNFRHVPFEVHPDTLMDINPAEDRPYLLRYVGNNYYKSETHVPVFEKLSRIGRVKVNGKYWTKEDRQKSFRVEYGPAITLSHDNLHRVYGSSLIGLSGASSAHDPSLYHLRWKEMLISGVYILNEHSEYLKPLLPEQPYDFETIRDADDRELQQYIDSLRINYVDLVQEQREQAMKFFSVYRWVPVWEEVLRIK